MSSILTDVAVVSDGALSGTWIGDDRAVYYVHHEADTVWWAGLSVDSATGVREFHQGLRFANIFRGRIFGSAIVGEWVDTPRGYVPQDGTLDLSIVSANEMRRLREVGGFGCSAWHRADGVAEVDISSRLAELFRDHRLVDRRLFACAEYGVAQGVVVRNLAADGDDLTFAIKADQQLWSPWTAPAVTSGEVAATIANQGGILECTILGRTGSSGLPGWMQREGTSVLFPAGRPVNGYASIATDRSARIFNRDLPPATHVRVSGCLTMRNGPSGPGDMVSVFPVYSIDVIAPVARGTLTGIWSSDDQGTYYLRHIGNTIWWLGMSHGQGRTFINVFHGMVVVDGSDAVIRGELVDMPRGTRRDATVLTVRMPNPTMLTAAGGASGRWTKMSG